MRHFGVSSTKSGLKDVTGKCLSKTCWLEDAWQRMRIGTNICMVTTPASPVFGN